MPEAVQWRRKRGTATRAIKKKTGIKSRQPRGIFQGTLKKKKRMDKNKQIHGNKHWGETQTGVDRKRVDRSTENEEKKNEKKWKIIKKTGNVKENWQRGKLK